MMGASVNGKPSASKAETGGSTPPAPVLIINKVQAYLKETGTELKKVVWPDRRYVLTATGVILVLVILTALFVMVLDYGLAGIFKVLMR